MKNHHIQSRSLFLAILVAITLPLVNPLSSPVSAEIDASPISTPTSTPTPITIPDSLPQDTKIRVDGDPSMKGINTFLKSKLESKFSGSTVELAQSNSTDALKALVDGKLDIAAIGRPLTEEEKAQGLTEVPVAFNKIAIFTSADNPFTGSLTDTQFVKIFRGEIQDWSEVGSSAGAIVLVDRPDNSDTRLSFSRYPVFKAAPFTAGSSSIKLDADNNDAAIAKLGTNGISYALADQVMGKPGIKIVALHQVFPDDQRYSFSQPLIYVYKTMTPAVQAFLGLAQDPNNARDIDTARKADVMGAAVPLNASTKPVDAASSTSPTTTSPTAMPSTAMPSTAMTPTLTQAPTAMDSAPTANAQGGSGFNWWLLPLLGIPLLGAAAFLLKPKTVDPIGPVVPITAVGAAGLAGLGALKSRLIAVPRDCQNAYAYWEIDEEQAQTLRSQGGEKFAMRIYDVTLDDLKRPDRNEFTQIDLTDQDTDCHFSLDKDDRDYMTELGYLNSKNEWMRLATSDVVHIPNCDLDPASSSSTSSSVTTAILEPSTNQSGFNKIEDAERDGVKIASNLPDMNLPDTSLPDENLPDENLSNTNLSDIQGAAIVGGIGLTGLAGAAINRSKDSAKVSQIVLVPRDRQSAYAHWELNPEEQAAAIAQGGQQFVLRVSDAHGRILDGTNNRHSFRQYDLSADSNDHDIHLPAIDRDYIAEVGYLTRDQRWISLARSIAVYCGAQVSGAQVSGAQVSGTQVSSDQINSDQVSS